MSKAHEVAVYRQRLGTNSRWALRGLLRIYSFQTENEQQLEATVEQNGVGFTGVDANLLSSYARQYQERGFLTKKQMAILHKLMPKYAGQLYRYALQHSMRTQQEMQL